MRWFKKSIHQFYMMNSKQEKITGFNSSGVGNTNNNIFGLPFNFEESDLILLPVPWEVTTSFGGGTSNGPQSILNASSQLDLYDPHFPDAWKKGIMMLDISEEWLHRNQQLKLKAQELILLQEKGQNINEMTLMKKNLDDINLASIELNNWVFEQTKILIERGKTVGLLGGDHSTPYGFIQLLAQHHSEFGILQIDAHADLRNAYEGFNHSHASIMFNVIKDLDQVKKLTQVGVRDICQAEVDLIDQSNGRIYCFYDWDLKEKFFSGINWNSICSNIIDTLPQKVYVSFDIDGLDPSLCPNTGTPVAGGLQIHEVFFLIQNIVKSGRKIIGFDLVEVSSGKDNWDGNVGARVLYKLCCALLT